MQSPSTHQSLLQLLSEGGDPAAWQVFHERYAALIRDYGRRSGLQPSDCDDLLQNVLLSLTRALPGFRYDPKKGSLRGYLKTVTLRAVSRECRQERADLCLEQVAEPSADDEGHWDAAWRGHHVRQAMQRLQREFPERILNAFQLYVLEERTPKATAELLGISIDSVYQAKTRVMRRISQVIAEQVAEEG